MTDPQRPIRIMRIIARLNIGGPAIHVTLLTQKLDAPEYESTLVCGQVDENEGDMIYFAREQGVEPHIIAELGRQIHPIRDLKTIWRLWRLMREMKPDVVHTHTAKGGFTGRVAAWMARVPVIVHTFHGHVFSGYFGPTKTATFVWLERLVATMADSILTLTDGLRRELAETYRIARKRKITVLPLGLDLERFAKTPRGLGQLREELEITSETPLIGIVGRLVPVKNHVLFIHAAKQIVETLPDTCFVIVGDGEEREALEAEVDRLDLRKQVRFLGWRKDMAPIFSDLDVKVISSVNEGTPVTIIEALSAGCPVVVTAVGGLPELLDGGTLGTLVPSGNTEALANAIMQTLANPPDVTQAQQAMLNRYGIDRLVDDLDGLYRGLLKKKGRL